MRKSRSPKDTNSSMSSANKSNSSDKGSTESVGSKRRSFSVLKRKRDDDDNISVTSFDVSSFSQGTIKRKLSKVASLTSLLTPSLSKRKRIVDSPVQEEWIESCSSNNRPLQKPSLVANASPISIPSSLKGSQSICTNTSASGVFTPPSRLCVQTPKQRRRSSRLWLETLPLSVLQQVKENLSQQEIKRQEALHELYQGEEDMVDDLTLVQKIYHDSLMRLGILNEDELRQIFGPFHGLLPLHQELVTKWNAFKGKNGSTEHIGELLIDWVPGLRVYVSYCANQILSRALLDLKKSNDSRLDDFLQRCIESPFSRRLDLWSFLDVPRSRLVKYPLLLKSILKHTPSDHKDKELLPKVISQVEEIIKEVDVKTGEAKCQHVLKNMDFSFRENRKKLQSFLFDTGFVLTRPITKWKNSNTTGNSVASTIYHVYRDPIPSEHLEVQDLKDGEVRIGGSFRNAFSSGGSAKNLVRVSCCAESGLSYTLQASDEHDKKQWLQYLNQIASKRKADEDKKEQNSTDNKENDLQVTN